MKPKNKSEARGEIIAPWGVITDMSAAGMGPTFTCETAENSEHRFDHCHLLNQVALYSRSRSFPTAMTDGFGLSKWLITQPQRNGWIPALAPCLEQSKCNCQPLLGFKRPLHKGTGNPHVSCFLGWERHTVSTRGSQSLQHLVKRLVFLLVLIPFFL